jgi:hypothetical protein
LGRSETVRQFDGGALLGMRLETGVRAETGNLRPERYVETRKLGR